MAVFSVVAAARRIENMYFDRRHAKHTILRLSRHGGFCDMAVEARIALDTSGQVLDATPAAQRVSAPKGTSLVGLGLAQIQGIPQCELLQSGADSSIQLPSGAHYFRLQEPRERTRTRKSRTVARTLKIEPSHIDEIIGNDPVVREAVARAARRQTSTGAWRNRGCSDD
ncbi:MAG: hypothetical protein LBQ32_05040 [Burkholderiaceae bacterium]|nr:hypothetical protein [Burkholderiaceae bacterium]